MYGTPRPKRPTFAHEMSSALKLDIRATDDLSVTRDSDIIVTCTSARNAFLTPDLVRPGTFIAAVGADNADKQEIAPALYSPPCGRGFARASRRDRRPAPCAGGRRGHDGAVHARLGEILTGEKSGRRDFAEITLFDSTGIGLQDVAAAARPIDGRSLRASGHAFP